MSTRVNIEASAWGNKKFALLAKYLGFVDSDHALIKCAVLWSWQTENYTSEAPTYVVDADTIDVCLGKDGAAAAMVRAGLAEECPNGFRICGSEGRIEWLWRCRQSSARGVAAKRAKADSDRNRVVNPPVNHPVDDCSTANNQQPPGQPVGRPQGQPGGEPTPQPSLLLVPEEEEKRAASRGSGSRANQPKSSAVQVIAHWNARFEKARGTRPFWPAAIQRLVDGLVKQFSVDEICARINAAFDTPPKWPEGPYDFETFARHFDKFLRGPRGAPTPGIRAIQTRAERERAALEAAEHDEESA